MDDTTAFTVVTSLITALGGTQAWEYYKKRSEQKRDEEMAQREDTNLYRDDLRKQVETLRQRLDETSQAKEEQIKEFLERINTLSQELAAMKVRVEFLERENANLRKSAGISNNEP